MSINNVRAVGDDRPWKDEVERELKSIMDALKYGKISLRAVSGATTGGGGGGGGADLSSITATSPATYDSITYTIGVDQDAFTHISNLDYAQFDTTAGLSSTSVGMLTWNDTDGTLEFRLKGGNVTLQIGQEQVMRVRNNTGSDLTEGTVVYITGSDGNNFNVAPALANADSTSAQTLGILTENITTSAQHGFVTTNGLVRNIDLSYITGLTAGDILYLDGTTAGRMTRTKPQAPTHMVYVGYCLSANGGGTNSTVFVKPQNGYELDELHDVQITSATDGDILQRNSSNLWVNKSLSAAGIATSANPTFTGTVTTPLTTAGYVTTTSGGVLSSVSTIPNAGLTNSAITVNGTSISLGSSGTVTAAPSGSAGGDLTGTYPNPTIKNDVVLTNPKIGRDNSASEGGQINFARASDNASYWYVDSYGSTSTPNLRFIEDTTPRFELVSGGAFSVSGQTGSAGQVLTSNGVGSAPTWNTVSGTSSNSFTTINAPAGTDPVATSSTDTLNLANGTGIGITGDSSTKTVTFGLVNTAVTAGSYGSATQVGTFTVDAQGRLTAAGNTSIAIAQSQVTNLTTDLAAKADTSTVGLFGIVPSSVAVGSGSGSAASDGTVTFTGASTVSLNGVFSSTYKNYKVILNITTTSGNTAVSFRMRASGSDNSTANSYLMSLVGSNTGGTAANILTTGTSGTFTYLPNGYTYGSADFTFINPFVAAPTKVATISSGTDSGYAGFTGRSGNIAHTQSTSYDGVTFIVGTTMAGTVKVYGFN